MHFRINIEPGVIPGEPVRTHAAGAEILVRVPKEAKNGQTFLFQITEAELERARQAPELKDKPIIENAVMEQQSTQGVDANKATQQQQQNQQQSKKKLKRKSSNVSNDETSFSSSLITLFTILREASRKPELYRDIGYAFCFGVALGLSILFGFVLGVLYITDPIEELNAKPPHS